MSGATIALGGVLIAGCLAIGIGIGTGIGWAIIGAKAVWRWLRSGGLTHLRWNLTVRWRLSGGEWYPFRGVPDEVVQRWADKDTRQMPEEQVAVVLKAKDEMGIRRALEEAARVCESKMLARNSS